MNGRRGGHHRRSSKQQSSEARGKAFAKTETMQTAKFQMHALRQASAAAAEEEYQGVPPPDPRLIQFNFVILEKYMPALALQTSTALSIIRKKHKMWITPVQPNILELRCENIRRLQQATRDLNWLMHDLQLAEGKRNTLFLAQKPFHLSVGAVRADLNTRPRAKSAENFTADACSVASDLFDQLCSDFVPSMNILMGSGAELKMRVNFGHLQVRSRQRGLGNEMAYPTFVKLLSSYSERGGAILDTRLENVHAADNIAQRLIDPVTGILDVETHGVQQRYAVLLQIGDQELAAEFEAPSAKEVHLSATRVIRKDKWPRLNWTVAAPDMEFDWNLQVESCYAMASISNELRNLVKGIVLLPDRAEGDTFAAPKPPRIVMTTAIGGDKVHETMLRTSTLVPFKDTPYIAEICVTQAWSGLKTNTDPETWWGVEFYGQTWDEAINHVNPGERRKDWGPDLRDIWLGRSEGLEERFKEFLEHVLEIQSVLGGENLRMATREEGAQKEQKPEEVGVLVDI